MVNADFSNGTITNKAPEGWTLSLSTSGVQSKISTEEKANGVIAGGQNHWQLWQASGALKGRAYQTTDRLPLGRYKLMAALATSFSGSSCTFKHHERFDINFVTGEWRETPTEEVFLSKNDWKGVDYSSQEAGINTATYAIDGNVNTFWHTQYSGTVAEAPHYITIDLDKQYTVKSFLATPRMDGNTNGLIRKHQFLVSADGTTWQSARSGDWMSYCTEVSLNYKE